MDKILYKGKELFSPKLDIVFKNLFGVEDSKETLRHFLNSVLDLNITSTDDIKLSNTEIVPNSPSKKSSRLDVCLVVENSVTKEHIDIEIQLENEHNMMKRSMFYVAKLFSNQLGSSENYNELGRAVCLSILDFNLFDDERYIHRGRIKDIETNIEFSDCLEVNFIEMKKLPKEIDLAKKPKELWLMFLNAKTEEELNMLVDQSPEIAVAVDKLERISSNEEFQHQALMREKALRDYNSGMANAEQRGIEKGKIEIARNLLLMNMSIDDISKATGLTAEEIEKIKSEI